MLFKKIILAVFAFTFIAPSFAGITGYVTDGTGKLAHDGFGHCVKTGTWKPENAIVECDPKLVKKPAPIVETNPSPVAKSATAVEAPPVVKPLPAPTKIVGTPLVLEKNVPLYLNAWFLFDFDKYTLTQAGKEVLDSVVVALKTAKYKTIKLDGYTDRFGSAKYNLKLSQKRADAVKAYLVSNGVDITKIKSAGHGKSNFVTKKADCKGLKTVPLKACYSKDRRVTLTLE